MTTPSPSLSKQGSQLTPAGLRARFGLQATEQPRAQEQLAESEPAASALRPPLDKRLIITGTSKGGVGKSFLMINLAEWFYEQHIPFLAYDPDYCNSTLTRFLPEAKFLDLMESSRMDDVIKALESTDLVLVDGIGALQGRFFDWMEETGVLSLREELTLDITVVLIVEEDKDTIYQAGEIAKHFGDKVHWLIVRNLKTSPTTEIYDNSNARKELLRLGAIEITIDRLPWNLLSITQKTSKTLSTIIMDESVFFLDRQRLRTYQAKMFDEFEKARSILLPGSRLRTSAVQQPPPSSPGARPRIAPEEV